MRLWRKEQTLSLRWSAGYPLYRKGGNGCAPDKVLPDCLLHVFAHPHAAHRMAGRGYALCHVFFLLDRSGDWPGALWMGLVVRAFTDWSGALFRGRYDACWSDH